MDVKLVLPDEALPGRFRSPDEVAAGLRLAAAAYWYGRGEVSQGNSARIAGMSPVEFIDALAREGVDAFHGDLAERDEELERARAAHRAQLAAEQPEKSQGRRGSRWLRFSVLSLMGIVALFGLWLGAVVHLQARQRKAIACIRRLDGDFASEIHGPEWLRRWLGKNYDEYFEHIIDVMILDSATEADLTSLSCLTDLEDLILESEKLTDEAMVHLESFTKLRNLHLGASRLSDRTLSHLGRMTQLRSITLLNGRYSELALKQLRSLPNLRKLTLPFDPSYDDAFCKRLQDAMPGVRIAKMSLM